ncbi:MAG: hypothetical protein CVU71_05575 [Deltaproteobacteria bacterium HGW-Deltaproteobacteria-6]|nr:MAG: hypothetical protein CVU71_05575 [Deltaproteobacteria bacterium HGW-Deltaproteobacteria-6]
MLEPSSAGSLKQFEISSTAESIKPFQFCFNKKTGLLLHWNGGSDENKFCHAVFDAELKAHEIAGGAAKKKSIADKYLPSRGEEHIPLDGNLLKIYIN